MADTTVEKISIDIQVSSQSAEQRLKRLEDSLSKLKDKAKGSAGEADKAVGGIGRSSSHSSKKIRGIIQDLNTLKKKLSSVGKSKALRLMFSIPMSPIKTAMKGITGITGKIGTLGAAIKRIAFYRLIRTTIKMFTQGMKEGLENLYRYSESAGTQFKKSMDSMATSALYMKNSLATIAEPLLNALAPVLDVIADKFAALAATVAEFLSALTGQTLYTKALKFPKAWKEEAEGAAKATQKWLGPFDEINRLSAPNSGSGGESLGFEKMFETVEVKSEGFLAKFAEKIKQGIRDGDLSEIGSIIGSKLKSALDNIPWEPIKKKAAKIGSSIGSFITGFFTEPGFTESIGRSLAEALNTGIEFFWSIKEKLDFEGLGSALGQGIRKFLETFDFKKFVGTVVGFGSGFVKYLVSALAEIGKDDGFTEIGKRIGEAIAGIDWYSDVFKPLTTLATTVIKALCDVIMGFTKDGELASAFQDLGKAVGEALADKELWEKAFRAAIGLGGAIVSGLSAAISSFLSELTGTDIDLTVDQKGGEGIFQVLAAAILGKKLLTGLGVLGASGAGAGAGAAGGAVAGAGGASAAAAGIGGLWTGLVSLATVLLPALSLTGAAKGLELHGQGKLDDALSQIDDSYTDMYMSPALAETLGLRKTKEDEGLAEAKRLAQESAMRYGGKQYESQARKQLAEESAMRYVGGWERIVEIDKQTREFEKTLKKQTRTTDKYTKGIEAASETFGDLIGGTDGMRRAIGSLGDQIGSVQTTTQSAFGKMAEASKRGARGITTELVSVDTKLRSTASSLGGRDALGQSGFTKSAEAISRSARGLSPDLAAIETGVRSVKAVTSGADSLGQTGFEAASGAIRGSARATTPDIAAIGTGTKSVKSILSGKNPLGETGFGTAAQKISGSARSITPELAALEAGLGKTKQASKAASEAFSGVGSGLKGAKKEIDQSAKGITGRLDEFTTEIDGFKKSSLKKLDGFGNGVTSGMSKTMKEFVDDGTGGLTTMLENFSVFSEQTARLMRDMSQSFDPTRFKRYGGGRHTSTPFTTVEMKANGGFVDSGQAFIARENGITEYVGHIGNRTAVATNDDIVAGVASGVEEANVGVVNAIYAGINQVVNAIKDNRDRNGAVDWDAVSRKITITQKRQAASAYV